jgi:TATA-binding protein-associated factor
MNLIGAPFDTTKIYRPSSGAMEEGHNVDKSMLEQDLSLVSEETVLKGKIAAAKALAILLALWPKEV